jgi:hypothetical protein
LTPRLLNFTGITCARKYIAKESKINQKLWPLCQVNDEIPLQTSHGNIAESKTLIFQSKKGK